MIWIKRADFDVLHSFHVEIIGDTSHHSRSVTTTTTLVISQNKNSFRLTVHIYKVFNSLFKLTLLILALFWVSSLSKVTATIDKQREAGNGRHLLDILCP